MKTAVAAPLLLVIGTLLLGAWVLRYARDPGALLPSHYGMTRLTGRTFPKTLDDGATSQTIPEAPRRVASLTVTSDEIFARILPPERLVAVTPFADDPAIETTAGLAPKDAARVRGTDPEAIIALQPDLVFVAHYTLASGVKLLSAASIPVVKLLDARSYEDVAANVRLAAGAVGEDARGEALLAGMRARLAGIRDRTRGLSLPRVLYYSAVGYTSGKDTLMDEKIRLAGGRNAAAEAGLVGFRDVALDLLVSLDPDVIIIPRWTADPLPPVRDVTDNVAWRDVRAVRTGRVYAIAASALTSESPDGTVGVEELARLLHPEAFSS